MLTFLFTLALIWLAIKLILSVWKMYQMRRNWRRMVNEMHRQANGFAGNASRQQAPPQQPQRRKHFSREDGEYVAFEEIVVDTKTTATFTDDNSTTTVETEERIVDAEWEDIRQ